MSDVLDAIVTLSGRGRVRASVHAYQELDADRLLFEEVLVGLASASAIEEYPDYFTGPCVLTLQKDSAGRPIHALWGMLKQDQTVAVLVTVYRPDPRKWSADFKSRRHK